MCVERVKCVLRAEPKRRVVALDAHSAGGVDDVVGDAQG
jgi:hypothetical protein